MLMLMRMMQTSRRDDDDETVTSNIALPSARFYCILIELADLESQLVLFSLQKQITIWLFSC
jgi:hypothetical protein